MIFATAFAALVIFFFSPAFAAFSKGKSTAKTVTAAAPTQAPVQTASFEDATQGKTVTFGKYSWLVLDKNEKQVRLLLFHAEKSADLRGRPYNDFQTDVTWETCTLRKWLNSEFLDNGFTEEEKSRILEKEVRHIDNVTYGVSGGNDTRDKVTLLRPEDLTRYSQVVSRIRMNIWLMAPGNSQDTASYMSSRNTYLDYGYPVSGTDFYVCPVIVVTLN